jgi:quinol monooxygenase YgiN
MVMTILEARVERQNWQTLETVFSEATKQLDPGLVQTFLARSKADEAVWRIISLWESQEALNAMRQSGETPRGVLIFREAGGQPALSIFEIIAQS